MMLSNLYPQSKLFESRPNNALQATRETRALEHWR
jgi:hypothetical protein